MAELTGTIPMAGNILAVDDSATQLEALRFILEEAGFTVIPARNGGDALAAAKTHLIELVITDVVMPDMDGYALCRALREDEELKHLPVIMLTSLTDPRDVIRGLESGANNFVYKPYEGEALLARVRTVLKNQVIRRAAPGSAVVSAIFAGQRYYITADRVQILDLLLSTYENAIDQNTHLIQARAELQSLKDHLEERISERTAALAATYEELRRENERLQSQWEERQR